MSVASHAASSQPASPSARRFRRSLLAASAVTLGAGLLLAPSASAADQWGPGYAIPDSHGTRGASHIGAYGQPGSLFQHTTGHGYCADPTLTGPESGGHYGPVTSFASWTSRATGKPASQQDIARASYVLSRYGDTTDDVQAAAVDADVYTYLNEGSTYALPGGQRALQRLAYPGVSAAAKTKAAAYLAEAARFAGPYTVHLSPDGPLTLGQKTWYTLDVTSAAGYKVPGVKLDLSAALGSQSRSISETTGADGTARAYLFPQQPGTVTFAVRAASLPATSLWAQIPANSGAQRIVLAGGTSTAQAQVNIRVTAAQGGLKVIKTASDTGKPLGGVEFAVRNKDGETVATGTTNAEGVWQAAGLPAGTYTLHEVEAADGYQLASDQRVVVTGDKSTTVAVRDARIPAPAVPRPRLVRIKVLPQTGA
ncbi:MAG: carboxypeptidase regulatory-like domain-containing protein [Streptomycetaceae bacterium]|nr:carboxypeptidase regulatory-like domain-containing protein [Streptomycetaceae bacterium]